MTFTVSPSMSRRVVKLKSWTSLSAGTPPVKRSTCSALILALPSSGATTQRPSKGSMLTFGYSVMLQSMVPSTTRLLVAW